MGDVNSSRNPDTSPPAASSAERGPRHVGIILDGNRRWARAKGLEVSEGHRAGATVVLDAIDWARESGVEILSLWLLSTDNFRRPEAELAQLFDIITDLACAVAHKGYPLRILCAENVLPAPLAERLHALTSAESATEKAEPNSPFEVNLAIGYGGRREIIEAVHALIDEEIARGGDLTSLRTAVSEGSVGTHLSTAGQSAPDLLIRTSGEQRLSGFLLWQSVHSELVFCETLWPDFTRGDFDAALDEYASRERRFGA
ncbi:polyprenyl diphosphate synthase [Dermabacter sp. HSID17554]|uniref:polyprenyl diphosphate synthase n=1 Tax=Dermabacter sp. HSID17554 TaxID=2419511 RepID=UPI000F8648BB|nr:polyprenyl diphosphate synthase [Dermabacter sp. HSID17554]RUP86157.1 di-trans,poly-cis-decaprenylcistransferase [Dermabacter sp. HSID17554]